MKWVIKASAQKFFSFFPFGFKVNQLFKGLRRTESSEADPYKIRNMLIILESIVKHFGKDNYIDRTILEIGSGWSVELPSLAWAYGFRNFILSDVAPLRRDDTVQSKLSSISKAIDTIPSWFGYDQKLVYQIYYDHRIRHRLDELSSLTTHQDFMNYTKYHYHYPIDFTVLDKVFDANSIDAVISNNTLEHIRPCSLYTGFNALNTILTRKGISLHIIDHNDHFEYVDTSITRLNMHTFTPFMWTCITSEFNYTNRFTVRDYAILLDGIHPHMQYELYPIDFIPNNVLDTYIKKHPRLADKKSDLSVSLSMLSIKKS